jgi:hypothetical protein
LDSNKKTRTAISPVPRKELVMNTEKLKKIYRAKFKGEAGKNKVPFKTWVRGLKESECDPFTGKALEIRNSGKKGR